MEQQKEFEEEEQEIINYGLQQLKYNGICILFTCFIAFIIGVFFKGCIFLTAFIPLRMYAGGYHADSQKKCFLVSFLAMSLSFLIIKYTYFSKIVACIVGIVCLGIIWKLAPVSNDTKRLDKEEIQMYGRRTKYIAVVVLGVFLALVYFVGYSFAVPLLMALMLVAISLISGEVKYRKKK